MVADVSMNAAMRAYELGRSLPATRSPVREASEAPSFAELLEKTARDTVATIHQGDRAAIAGLRGEISTQAVVEASMEMETALKTTVAVRDKLVEAYQEVLRMAV